IHVGLAVDTDRGLLVPVVRQADSKSIPALDEEISALAQRALDGQLLPDELTGGTFTITNLGAFGIDAFTPIVNPPETAVLGIGRISPRPVVVGRQVEVRDMVVLSLSFDHRLLDGGPAARFLQRVGQLVERPFALVQINN
ncbi:MAG: 2-oxo acid dehydrogenase subunit E2, partial [Anaerolineales bacterium]|nr:2-oxo acid dehydrogenase subunit E2 [Anaerolineales bacterium]